MCGLINIILAPLRLQIYAFLTGIFLFKEECNNSITLWKNKHFSVMRIVANKKTSNFTIWILPPTFKKFQLGLFFQISWVAHFSLLSRLYILVAFIFLWLLLHSVKNHTFAVLSIVDRQVESPVTDFDFQLLLYNGRFCKSSILNII